MKRAFLLLVLIAVLMPAGIKAQNYFEDTVWTKKTDQYMGFWKVKFSQTDSIIVGQGMHESIFYDAFTGDEMYRLPFNAEVHFIENDNKFIQLAPNRDRLVIYDTKTYLPLDTLEFDDRKIGTISISNDESTIIGVVTKGLRRWNLHTGQIMKTKDFEMVPGLVKIENGNMKFILDDNRLVVGEIKKYIISEKPIEYGLKLGIKIYDVNTLDSIDYFSNKFDFELSETNQYIAFNNGESNNGVEIYDFATKQLLRRLPVNGPSLTGIEFSPDDKYIVTSNGPGQNSLIVWNVETGNQTHRYWPSSYSTVDVSHNGSYILAVFGRRLRMFYARFGPTNVPNNEDGNEPLIYPNPSTGEVNIPIGNRTLKGTVRVYDVSGNIVLTHPLAPSREGVSVRFDVSELPSGTYMVIMDNGVSYKLIVNK